MCFLVGSITEYNGGDWPLYQYPQGCSQKFFAQTLKGQRCVSDKTAGGLGGTLSPPVGPEQSPENFKNLALKFPQKQRSYHTPKAFTKPIFDTQFFPFLLSFFISGLIHKWIEKKNIKFFYRNKTHLK